MSSPPGGAGWHYGPSMAIDDLLDEHEQSERVLEWLRNNGAGLIGGIVLGLAAIGGWKWWEQDRQQQALSVADRYQTAVDQVEAGDERAATSVASLEGTVYGALAAMDLAAAQVREGRVPEAITTLRGIQPTDPAMAAVVDQRLARLLIDSGDAEAALELLAGQDDPNALQVRGDAYVALDRPEEARESYESALAELEPDAPQRRIIELKFMEVGGVPASTEAQS